MQRVYKKRWNGHRVLRSFFFFSELIENLWRCNGILCVFQDLLLSYLIVNFNLRCRTSDGFWINSNTCSNPVSPLCPPGMDSNLNGTCLCSSDCSMLGDFACRGTPYYLTSNGGSFSSLRSVSSVFDALRIFNGFRIDETTRLSFSKYSDIIHMLKEQSLALPKGVGFPFFISCCTVTSRWYCKSKILLFAHYVLAGKAL